MAASRALWLACGTSVLLTAVGCGLPVVEGIVTLDGEPLPNATVFFLPQDETQTPAQGTTDATGKYTLEQEAGTSGIKMCEYTVRISTYRPGSWDADPPTPATSESVPAKYNLETELKVVVTRRSSTRQAYDFALVSDGETIQPAPESYGIEQGAAGEVTKRSSEKRTGSPEN